MEKSKDRLFSLLNLRSNYLTGSRFKGSRRLETTGSRLEHRVRSRQYAVSNFLWHFFAYCLLLIAYWLYLLTANCQLSTAFADEIRIRTIVTPIGSQSEKWGAAGLMVCIGGEPINQGGCGSSVTKGWKIKEDGTKEQIEIKNNDIIIFKDTYPSANPNHQFDGGSVESWADTIYEVRGAGGGSGNCVLVEDVRTGAGSITATASCPAGKSIASAATGKGSGSDSSLMALHTAIHSPSHSCVGQTTCSSTSTAAHGGISVTARVSILCCE